MEVTLETQVPMADTASNLDSEAWLLVGLTRTLAGRLVFDNGCLTFADEDGSVHFSTPLSEVERIWSPWYYFGGGLKMRVDGVTFRITFTLPNDQPGGNRQPHRFGSDLQRGASAASFAWGKFNDIARGRELTRRWKTALAVT
jgi:hypothetical protein